MSEKRLYHTVANKLLELIDSGVFPPGSRLPGERELANVSIREAEIALQAQGRVEIKVGSGVYVLDRSNLPVFGLPKVGPFELTEARALFEGEAAALAAPMITDKELAHLEYLIDVMIGSLSSKPIGKWKRKRRKVDLATRFHSNYCNISFNYRPIM